MKPTEQGIAGTPLSAVKVNVSEMPKHETDALCRVLLRSVAETFKNPVFAAEYEAWRLKRYGEQPQGAKA